MNPSDLSSPAQDEPGPPALWHRAGQEEADGHPADGGQLHLHQPHPVAGAVPLLLPHGGTRLLCVDLPAGPGAGLLMVLCFILKGTPDVKLFSKPMALSLLCKYLLKAFVSSVSPQKMKNAALRWESLSLFPCETFYFTCCCCLDEKQKVQTASAHHGDSQGCEERNRPGGGDPTRV